MKLSYINAIAELCERLGADIGDVTAGMGYDRRIGPSFLRPGPGWGGSCLPKDVHALLRVADATGFDFDLLDATLKVNDRQVERVLDKVCAACGIAPGGSLDGVRLGLLGLTFKANTNDLRDSPALAVARALRERGAELVAYDPSQVNTDPAVFGELLTLVGDPYQAAKDVTAVVLLTEWQEFRTLDWGQIADSLAEPVVVDTRNHVDPDVLSRVGINWYGVGTAPRLVDTVPAVTR
jgi:UDPglucose 6-dehydrogenase